MTERVYQIQVLKDTSALVKKDFLGKTVGLLVRVQLLLMNKTSLLHHLSPATTTESDSGVVPTAVYQQPAVWAIAIFIVVLAICVLAYIGYHNRNKVGTAMYVLRYLLFYVFVIDPRAVWREEGECS